LQSIVTSLAGTAASTDPDPFVTRLLLTQYRATGRDDLYDALGPVLARALEHCACVTDPRARAEWLLTFADATAISDDERLLETARELLTGVCASPLPICLDASLRGAVATNEIGRIASIVDRLEHAIAHAYEPGEGVVLDRARGFQSSDQAVTASALLTAYEITLRLPYSMLAEELMQTARLRGWHQEDVSQTCVTVSVLCRLAALHRDADYRKSAVLAREANYRSDAGDLIARRESQPLDNPRDAAAFGLALAQWLDLQ
jgi:hypothetical protein